MNRRLDHRMAACLLAIAATSCGGQIPDEPELQPAIPADQPTKRFTPILMTAPTTTYTNEGQQRILRLINTLSGHEITGRAPSDLARETDCTASTITRDLANLKEAGFAEVVPETGCWRLSPQIVQIAIRHMSALDRAAQRLEEVRGRFSRSAV